MSLIFRVVPERCVECMACVRVCPVEAVEAVAGPPRIVAGSCIECGLCVPACQHEAIQVVGDLPAVRRYLDEGNAVLILATESVVHFRPASISQLLNAGLAAGFRVVSSGVLGDELVAHAYLELWKRNGRGTVIRSSSPLMVEYVRRRHPELLPFLAPVVTPAVAQARYLKTLYGNEVKVVYAGLASAGAGGAAQRIIAAAITFAELEALFGERGVDPLEQPRRLKKEGLGGRRHLSTAGGMPLPLLKEERAASRRFRKVRGLEEVGAIAETIGRSNGGARLGFIDLLPYERDLDHPLMGPKEQLYLRREIAARAEPRRSRRRVLDPRLRVDLSCVQRPAANGKVVTAYEVAELLDREIGRAADGTYWDCGACGLGSCTAFAAAVLRRRARLDICPFYQARRSEVAAQDAGFDSLTQLYSYRTLHSRLIEECARLRRTGGRLAVIVVDLDRFRPLNDRFGPEAGNQILGEIGSIIKDSIRLNDFAARFGSDEFVIVLPDGDRTGAVRVTEAIRSRVAAIRTGGGSRVSPISLSVGIAEVGPEGSLTTGHEAVLAAADAALAAAKQAGGDAIRFS